MDAPERLGEMLFAEVPAGWPPGLYDRDAMGYFLAKLLDGGPEAEGWYGWYAIRRATTGDPSRAEAATPAVLIGTVGYFGPPAADGTVEIGYSVVAAHRTRGYATEMVRAVTARALEMPGVTAVVAEVHEFNIASRKALERAGFRHVAAGRDPGHLRFQFHAA